MEEDQNRDSKEQEPTLKSILLIEQFNTKEGFGYGVRHHNEGITKGEIISITEAWLEKARKEHREEIGFDV
ncbi:hypothetical protein HZA96_05120 [Candidatus Woesearchaeota archaeon]|nr:hypothetical protein [Candidatus Woesearchaeota archaeon]